MIYKEKFLAILNSREERQEKQYAILRKYPFSLISFTLNTPGIDKDSQLYRRIHDEGIAVILGTLKDINRDVKYLEKVNKNTGSEGYISVDIDSYELKRLMVDIEVNHPLGRIFDIDVFDKDHTQMSRTDLGLDSRKCLLCDKDAKVCMREKNHTYEELILNIENLGKEYFNRL